MAKETHTDEPKGQKEVVDELTYSGGPDNDQENTREERHAADPSLAPEIAEAKEEEAVKKADAQDRAERPDEARGSRGGPSNQ